MSVKAMGEQTNRAFSLLAAEEPAGFGPALHVHRDAAEAFYVLEGEYVIFLDHREFVCPAAGSGDVRQAAHATPSLLLAPKRVDPARSARERDSQSPFGAEAGGSGP